MRSARFGHLDCLCRRRHQLTNNSNNGNLVNLSKSTPTLLTLTILIIISSIFPPFCYAYNNNYYSSRKKVNLTIGYLTAVKGDLKDRQGLAISGALAYALDEVRLKLNLNFVETIFICFSVLDK